RVDHVVTTKNRQVAFEAAVELKRLTGDGRRDVGGAQVCFFAQPVNQRGDFVSPGGRGKLRRLLAHDDEAAAAEGRDDGERLGGEAFEIVEDLQMLFADAGDDGDVRLGDPTQGGDFAGVIRADFNDDEFIRRLNREQSKGDADLVVEAGLGGLALAARAEN